jgi:phage shock protein C
VSETEQPPETGATDVPGPAPPSEKPGTRERVATELRLARSRDDRVVAGVCAGLARYLGIDPVLVRIAALLLIFAGGAGIVLYVIGWIAMPEEPAVVGSVPLERTDGEDRPERPGGAVVLGVVFVALGAFFLVDAVWGDFLSWKYVWPVALIAVGAAILLSRR